MTPKPTLQAHQAPVEPGYPQMAAGLALAAALLGCPLAAEQAQEKAKTPKAQSAPRKPSRLRGKPQAPRSPGPPPAQPPTPGNPGQEKEPKPEPPMAGVPMRPKTPPAK
ncbi:hypothetical protein [Holophaga foetida]|uniref:hypothetical protein n=1 Tax=Holophaga foetida TaxID=35839 RepID=UPI00024717B6|nr:hypothetical protein [Holophaga foetida]